MSSLSDFYSGKGILLTGVTGFVGKVLLEKLLWEFCRRDSRSPVIYVLVRSSSQSSEDRLRELLKSPAFQRLGNREDCSLEELRYCLRAVDGDLEKEKLGLSEESYQELATAAAWL